MLDKRNYQHIIDYLIYGNDLFDDREKEFSAFWTKYIEPLSGQTLLTRKSPSFFPLVSHLTTLDALGEHWNKLLLASLGEKYGVKKEECPPLYLTKDGAPQLRFQFV